MIASLWPSFELLHSSNSSGFIPTMCSRTNSIPELISGEHSSQGRRTRRAERKECTVTTLIPSANCIPIMNSFCRTSSHPESASTSSAATAVCGRIFTLEDDLCIGRGELKSVTVVAAGTTIFDIFTSLFPILK
uniref:Uncharacterized protein n=1 Tax=Ciona savignyi TaxID=51511 RepID=H2Z2E6_CIOSA